jgi:ATP-binding cassette subfamily C protein EexD
LNFAGIAENIARLGEPDSRWLLKLRKAGLHELILQMPNGYDTQIGRVEQYNRRTAPANRLARAIYGILDSCSDDRMQALTLPETAGKRHGTLEAAGTTTIFITHNPHFISNGKLLVMQNGALAAFGPKEGHGTTE